MKKKENAVAKRYRYLSVLVLVLMLITEWRMALAVIGVVIIGLLLMYIAGKHTKRNAPAQREARNRLGSYAQEIYRGHDVVFLSRAVRQAKENFRELNGAVYSTSRRAQFSENLRRVFVVHVGSLALAVVWISGAWLALKGEIGLGIIAVFMLYVGVLTLSLDRLNIGT